MVFTVDQDCPHCGKRDVSFVLRDISEYMGSEAPQAGGAPVRVPRVTIRTGDTWVRAYGVSLCPKCYGPLLIWFECGYAALQRFQQAGEHPEWRYAGQPPKILATYPGLFKPDDSPHYPERLRGVYTELQEDVRAKRLPSRIASGCRSVMEVALRELGYGNHLGSMRKRVAKAREDGLITKSLEAWAHRVQLDGSFAIHELEATDEEAAHLMAFIKLFLEVAFILPARIPQEDKISSVS